jgi:aryl carrier-like protein
MPSGKANRKLMTAWLGALSTTDLIRYHFDSFGRSVNIEAPISFREHFLQAAFQRVLGLSADMLGRNANFLSLGGDSISAINLASHVRKHGRLLSVSTILKTPVLRDVAEHLNWSGATTPGSQGFQCPVAFQPRHPQFYGSSSRVG